MIIERNHCSKCKAVDVELINYAKSKNQNGDTVIYKYCLPCNAEKHKKWYENNPQKAQIYNRRYRIKNFMDL